MKCCDNLLVSWNMYMSCVFIYTCLVFQMDLLDIPTLNILPEIGKGCFENILHPPSLHQRPSYSFMYSTKSHCFILHYGCCYNIFWRVLNAFLSFILILSNCCKQTSQSLHITLLQRLGGGGRSKCKDTVHFQKFTKRLLTWQN